MKIVQFRQDQSLESLVTEIRGHMYDAQGAKTKFDKHRLAAGQKLLDLRRRVEAGEAGEGINWWEWYGTQFTRSRKDAEKLIRMASADDPEEAFEEDRAKRRKSQIKTMERSAPSDDDIVDRALNLIEEMDAEQRERFDAAYRERYHG